MESVARPRARGHDCSIHLKVVRFPCLPSLAIVSGRVLPRASHADSFWPIQGPPTLDALHRSCSPRGSLVSAQHSPCVCARISWASRAFPFLLPVRRVLTQCPHSQRHTRHTRPREDIEADPLGRSSPLGCCRSRSWRVLRAPTVLRLRARTRLDM